MCGIVGYIGNRNAVDMVMDGLRRLEYRGYDSAGIAILNGSGIEVRREAGKLGQLAHLVSAEPVTGTLGIGHTRWATHGAPTQHNAHPHSSVDGRLVVVQNGIVENFQELRKELQQDGYVFASETDTEVIVHLIHRNYENGANQDLLQAIRSAAARIEGPSAFAVICADDPRRLVVIRLGNAGGVVVGLGDGESFLASDIPALLPYTRQVKFLADQQMAVITPEAVEITDLAGRPIDVQVTEIDWDADAAEKGDYAHFMQKEIYEQGESIQRTLAHRIDFEPGAGGGQVNLAELGLTPASAQRLRKLTIVACGTSYYAGLVGKFLIECLARLPVEVDYASEYRYRRPIVGPNELVLAITQSGETVDTLAALEEARSIGASMAAVAYTAAIVNSVGSQASRVCDGIIYMHAGPEIGVASTKAYTTSLVDLTLLALYLGQQRGTISDEVRHSLVQGLSTLPGQVAHLLGEAQSSSLYAEIARQYGHCTDFLYLGRGINYPTALEGALKLKEISYIHAEGYPAGEMKHGPIALLDEDMPTVVVAPKDGVYDKMVSQIEQVKARGGPVLAVARPDDDYISGIADSVLPIPASHELLTPVLAVLPLQLLAYEMAVYRGNDVDQPRNLAKSVTVE